MRLSKLYPIIPSRDNQSNFFQFLGQDQTHTSLLTTISSCLSFVYVAEVSMKITLNAFIPLKNFCNAITVVIQKREKEGSGMDLADLRRNCSRVRVAKLLVTV